MIVIKFKTQEETADYKTFNVGVLNLGKAIYWLKQLRLSQHNSFLLSTQPTSWLEINGFIIPDSILFILTDHKSRQDFLDYHRSSTHRIFD